MDGRYGVDDKEVESLLQRLRSEAESTGYHLNPDKSATRGLVEGLAVNQKRYGYIACPCRLASGDKTEDLDIICPCDYRDPDIADFGACYCSLYVSTKVCRGEAKVEPVPERRLPSEKREKTPETTRTKGSATTSLTFSYPVWRCKVCGYLCARTGPPDTCPICKVPKERFEKFI